MINRRPFKKRLGRLDANKITVFYSDTKTSVWSLGKGLCTTLSSMGYVVVDAPSSAMPEQYILDNQDMILVSGPEYLWERLRAKYPNWDQLKAKKYGWMHETVEREDYASNPIARDGTLPVADVKRLTPHVFTPAAQDTKYGFVYLPFGVDTKVFTPSVEKDAEIVFIGSMYGKRRVFMENNPQVSVLGGTKDYLMYKSDLEFSAYLRYTTRAMAVLNLPTLSLLNSTRVYEAMACKALTITPLMGGHPDNYSMFKDRVHLLYYQGSPVEVMNSVIEVVYTGDNNPRGSNRGHSRIWHYAINKTAKDIAEAGYEEVKKNHTLESRLEKILR